MAFKQINCVLHLDRYVDDMLQDDMSTDNETHDEVTRRVAEQLWCEGHIDGLRSGSDWSEWLAKIDMNAILDFAQLKTAQITPGSE